MSTATLRIALGTIAQRRRSFCDAIDAALDRQRQLRLAAGTVHTPEYRTLADIEIDDDEISRRLTAGTLAKEHIHRHDLPSDDNALFCHLVEQFLAADAKGGAV